MLHATTARFRTRFSGTLVQGASFRHGIILQNVRPITMLTLSGEKELVDTIWIPVDKYNYPDIDTFTDAFRRFV